MNSKAKGEKAELLAIEFLKNHNFQIIKHHFYCKGGEIDIIAYKDNVYHFIEVKSGKNEPIYNITPTKLKRIIKCVNFFLLKHKITLAYQIDAIVIKDNNIEIIENITL
jgi:putative endonuclease